MERTLTTIDTAITSPNNTTASWFPPDCGGRHYVWSMTPDLQEIEDADPVLIKELLALFLDDSVTRLQILRGASPREDFKILRAQAHSLKGSALQIGASGLASLCAALELSDSPAPEQSGAMVNAIHGEFALVRLAIDEYIAGPEIAGPPVQKRKEMLVAG